MARAASDQGARGPRESGVPPLHVVLSDRRLVAARDLDAVGDSAAAAREVERVASGVALNARAACAWDYVAGRLYLAAGLSNEASMAFGRAGGALSTAPALAPVEDASVDPTTSACLLGHYAHLREAQAFVRLRRFDEAIAALRSIPDEFAAKAEATLTLADAYAAKGDRASAIALWRARLTEHPRGIRWVDVAIQLATALLEGADGPPETHAEEALEHATRVAVESPTIAEKVDVATLRDRASRALKAHAAPPLTPEERARQAQAWLDEGQPKRARDVAQGVLRTLTPAKKEHADAACKAAMTAAQATPRAKPDDDADAWGIAIARCETNEAFVVALYQGGRASASAKRRTEAVGRFEEVEKRFPTHRLADDARLRAASAVQDAGDDARALSMLWTLPDVYPEGDMRGEALFRVSLARLSAGDLEGAKASLDRQLTEAPDAMGSASAGRAEYFRARVAEVAGEFDDAKARYAAVVENQPLSYYMLLAYARLRAQDDALARSTLRAAVERDASSPIRPRGDAALATPAFQRFTQLLDVGEIELARRDAAAAGLMAEGVDPAVLLAVGWLYDHAGAPELGHAFARSRLVAFRSHWPAGPWRMAWETAFPRPWDDVVIRESDSAHIPVPLTWAIMREESAFNPEARSIASALGLMQLMGPTARRVARDTLLPFDDDALRRPEVSIALGARLLGSLRASFPSHPALAIAAYNSGGVPVRRWVDRGPTEADLFVERIPYDETRNYVKRVLGSEAAYAYLYAPAGLDELLGARILSMTASPVAPTAP